MGQLGQGPDRNGSLSSLAALPKLASLLEDLSLYEDRSERIEALVDYGRRYRHESSVGVLRTDGNRVPGCESEVYLGTELSPLGKLEFEFAVDNPQGISAMALAVILKEGLAGATPVEVQNIPNDIALEIFGKELSMGKNLGLSNMVKMLKADALALAAQAQAN